MLSNICKKTGICFELLKTYDSSLISYSDIFYNKNNGNIEFKYIRGNMPNTIILTGNNRTIFETQFELIKYEEIYGTENYKFLENVIKENLKDIAKLRSNDILLISYDINSKSLMELEDLEITNSIIRKNTNKSKTLDVIIRSAGGNLSIPNLLLHQLHNKYSNINIIVPYFAHSAATLFSFGGKEIIMHENATFSPFDPQFDKLPAYIHYKGEQSLKQKIFYKTEIKKVKNISKNILLKYMIDCSNYNFININNTILTNIKQIVKCKSNYFRAIKISKYFTSFSKHLDHNTPIFYDDCKKLGLNIKKPDKELEKLMMENEVLLSYIFKKTNLIKIFANTKDMIYNYQKDNKN